MKKLIFYTGLKYLYAHGGHRFAHEFQIYVSDFLVVNLLYL